MQEGIWETKVIILPRECLDLDFPCHIYMVFKKKEGYLTGAIARHAAKKSQAAINNK